MHYEGFIEIEDFDVESESYDLFLKLCDGEFTGRKIGEGEAAAITLAVENNGILASNNTRDVEDAVKRFNLIRIRTCRHIFFREPVILLRYAVSLFLPITKIRL